MDDLQMQARNDATPAVVRDFEPNRIERQLIVHAFELVCKLATQTFPTPQANESSVIEQPASSDIERRRAA